VRYSVYVPFAISLVAAVLAPEVSRRMAPRVAAWGITAAALVLAASTSAALALLAFTGFGQIPQVAEQGRWSIGALRAADPVSRGTAEVCGVLLGVAAVSLAVTGYQRIRLLVAARRACDRMNPHTTLAVIDDPVPHAYALPGRPGRVVLSTGMLRTLGPEERRAVLAHENAHLHHRHHRFVLALHLAAALNPLLRPLRTAGAFALERWADEEAAGVITDRRTVARALGVAALAAAQPPAAALAAAVGPVPRRVAALLAPPKGRRTLWLVAGTVALLLCVASLAEAAHDTELIFEAAKHARR
jgi:Zn-dependent protease with chaperone function